MSKARRRSLPRLLLALTTLAGCTDPNPDFVPSPLGSEPDLRGTPPRDSSLPPGDSSLPPGDGILPPLPDLSMPVDLRPPGGDLTMLPAQILLVPMGSRWHYLDDGSDQGMAWRTPGFDDSGWRTGPAQLGYGDMDEATVIGFGPNANAKYITSYFRFSFDTAFAASVKQLNLRVVRDDGIVIYLNGTEVVRDNLPMGAIDYRTLAPLGIAGADESAWNPFTIAGNLLVQGRNVVAVEVHQNLGNSSDLSFDMEMIGVTN